MVNWWLLIQGTAKVFRYPDIADDLIVEYWLWLLRISIVSLMFKIWS